MSYLDRDDDAPEDPDRRALLIALGGSVPVVGGILEVLGRAMLRPAEREAAKAGARVMLEAEPQRFPFGKASEAAADRAQRQDQQNPATGRHPTSR